MSANDEVMQAEGESLNALTNRKLMVVGATSGLGRASAIALTRAGADVVFAARRHDELQAAVAEAGRGHVVTIDVMDEDDITRSVDTAVEVLGGRLDGVLYTAGMSPLAAMTSLTLADWHQVFGVNTFGPSLVIRAALPHLSEDAVVAVVSSDSSEHPRHSLVPYAAAKRALEATMEGWRTEVLGGRRFVTVVLGPTQPTGFGDAFDPAAFGSVMGHWQRQGFSTGFMHADEVAAGLTAAFASMFESPTFGMETLLLRAPEPVNAISDFGLDS